MRISLPLVVALAFFACNGKDEGAPADTDTEGTATVTGSATGTGTGAPVRTVPADLAGCTATAEYDDGADDAVESSVTRSYDADGLVHRQEFDDDFDGGADRVFTFTFDGEGRTTEEWTDSDADDDPDAVIFHTYHACGALERTVYDTKDTNFDGVPESVLDGDFEISHTWTVDAARCVRTAVADDLTGDGLPEYQSVYIYDDQDRLIRFDQDFLGTGVGVDNAWSYSYPNASQPLDLVKEYDFGVDGSFERRDAWQYDDRDRLAHRSEDTDYDDTPELDETITYNPDGTIATQGGTYYDPANPALPPFESMTTTTYDDEGYLTQSETEVDVDHDNVTDNTILEHWTWSCP